MSRVQEIKSDSKAGSCFESELEISGVKYLADFSVDGVVGQCPLESDESFADVFQQLIDRWQAHLKRAGDNIDWIDNPCNTELLSLEKQEEVLAQLELDDVELRLNGIAQVAKVTATP